VTSLTIFEVVTLPQAHNICSKLQYAFRGYLHTANMPTLFIRGLLTTVLIVQKVWL